MSISLCSFVFNEEKNIDNWLFPLKPFVSEILIFDLESTDNTFELCKKYTDKVYRRPYLLCGDYYKQELHYMAKGDWLLWLYPDERLCEASLNILSKLCAQDKWNVYSFMRHEYMDGILVRINQNERTVAFGTSELPNYQGRLHKNDGKIVYSELVHAEFDGSIVNCALPPEYYMEHWKTSGDQEFDNIRLYILYKQSILKFRNTQVQPYKRYLDSYRKIIHDSEVKNLSGERKIHLSEEFWWEWNKYIDTSRISLDEFKSIVGVSYEEFLKCGKEEQNRFVVVDKNLIDEKIRVKES